VRACYRPGARYRAGDYNLGLKRSMNPAPTDYTPVSVMFLPEPLITWADLRGVRFEEPFFRDTLCRLSPERSKALTGIDELRALDGLPTLEPSLFIFQVSRCGSTLVSQMLATLATNVVISEAKVIGGILSARPEPVEKAELLRLIIRALGRNRGSDARHLIVKFTSWNVLSAGMIHRAFPDTPMIWLQRDPFHVVASHAHPPAGWTAWRNAGNPALSMFGLTVEQARTMSAARFRLHAIETLYRSAYEAKLPWQVVDYAELPTAVWGKIASHARLPWDASEVERMRERARFDSKAEDNSPFVARDYSRDLSAEEKQFVTERIEPLYRAIGAIGH